MAHDHSLTLSTPVPARQPLCIKYYIPECQRTASRSVHVWTPALHPALRLPAATCPADSVCVRVLSEETEMYSLSVQLTQYVYLYSWLSMCESVTWRNRKAQFISVSWLSMCEGVIWRNRNVQFMCPADSVCVRVLSEATEMSNLLPSVPVLATHILACTLHNAS